MKRALELALKGQGLTCPNPCVGAVIVKGGRIIAEGWHRKAGEDHAEIVAIKHLMQKSKIVTLDIDPMLFHNATLYVTLEPCCHVGKTSACAKTIVEAGFKKVCIGMKDPFKKVNGKGILYLKKHGVTVQLVKNSSELYSEIRSINQPFIKWATFGMPYVVMKSGISLDGKIATANRQSKWITCEKSRQDAKNFRSSCDSVLVGKGTVEADNPTLDCLRIILDRRLSLDTGFKVFRDQKVFVACSDLASKFNKARFTKAGIKFKSFGKKDIDIAKLLAFLGKQGIQSVFVEGGSEINGAFFNAAVKGQRVLDKVLFYLAPKLIGGRENLAVIGGDGVSDLKKALDIKSLEIQKIGEDFRASGFINFY